MFPDPDIEASGVGYLFSGAITSIIGDFRQIGVALFFIILFAVVLIYAVERFWLSEKVEEADPETIHKIEEKLHAVEEVAHEKLYDLTERLHLTRDHNKDESEMPPPRSKSRTGLRVQEVASTRGHRFALHHSPKLEYPPALHFIFSNIRG